MTIKSRREDGFAPLTLYSFSLMCRRLLIQRAVWVLCFSTLLIPSAATLARPAGPGDSHTKASSTLSRSKTLVIAHRGGALEAPENTLSAFLQARRAGADGIETDVRLTRDGKVVLYHDARVGRVEWGEEESIPNLSGLIEEIEDWSRESPRGYAGLAEKILIGLQKLAGEPKAPLISQITYSQLQSDQARRPTGAKKAVRVPTLDEALRRLPSGLIDLDIKTGPRRKELLNKIIAALRNFRDMDRVIIEPPDIASAQMLRSALGPNVKLQVTPGLWLAEPFEKSLERALELKPHSISVPSSLVSPELVERVHAAGVEVWAWTIDSADVAKSMELMGVDAIKTDRPTAIVSSLSKPSLNPFLKPGIEKKRATGAGLMREEF
ncbi:MAG TPA: glycerophosphodiester phosphodiesterase [Blastocatellia bacterium]|nr:glycerophosphodiester phosphodiesterase [Blastocatellia bacterium]